MFRFLYVAIAIGGLFWVLQTRPAWMAPMRAAGLEEAREEVTEPWQRSEEARMDEMFRRLKWVGGAVAVVVVTSEISNLLRRTLRRV